MIGWFKGVFSCNQAEVVSNHAVYSNFALQKLVQPIKFRLKYFQFADDHQPSASTDDLTVTQQMPVNQFR